MTSPHPIYILGAGAVGFPLAVYLAHAGRTVLAVRTSRSDIPKATLSVTVQSGEDQLSVPIETISLSHLPTINGTIVITAKSHANHAIAQALRAKGATGPIVLMQNGLGVEAPFLDAHFSAIYRCVLYVTAQPISEHRFMFRPVTTSPIGMINGDEAELQQSVDLLTTSGFPLRAEPNIQREIWKKAIINTVFNSICPLLDSDNGIFVRDEAVANLAREVISECVTLTDRLNIGVGAQELMEQLFLISKRSDGQLISTLQDIRSGRPTEIASLNLAIAAIAAALHPPLVLHRTAYLGKMIVAKSALTRQR